MRIPSTSSPSICRTSSNLGAGVALANAPPNGNINMSTPLDKAGVASAANDTTRELGDAIGVEVGGSLVGTIYSAPVKLTSLTLPQVANDAASDSIGGAFGVAARIGGET